jgi:hypothetical protein
MHEKELTASQKACKHGLQASLQSGKRGWVPIVSASAAAPVTVGRAAAAVAVELAELQALQKVTVVADPCQSGFSMLR